MGETSVTELQLTARCVLPVGLQFQQDPCSPAQMSREHPTGVRPCSKTLGPPFRHSQKHGDLALSGSTPNTNAVTLPGRVPLLGRCVQKSKTSAQTALFPSAIKQKQACIYGALCNPNFSAHFTLGRAAIRGGLLENGVMPSLHDKAGFSSASGEQQARDFLT